MKKSVMALLASALAFVAAPAYSSPPLCIDFVNFCDGLQIQIDNAAHTISGKWHNWDCAGTDEPITGGVRSLSEYRIFCSTAGCPGGLLWMFVVHAFHAGFTFDLYGSDGINPPFLQQLNQPYTVNIGACAFTGTDKASVSSSQMR